MQTNPAVEQNNPTVELKTYAVAQWRTVVFNSECARNR